MNTLRIRGPVHFPLPIYRRDVVVPARTTGGESLLGRRALVLVDLENLFFSLRNLDRAPRYAAWVDWLDGLCRRHWVHLFYSRPARLLWLDDAFREFGFRPHPRGITAGALREAGRSGANSDGHLLFTAGFLARTSHCDTVVAASGDGDLVCQLAESVAGLPKQRQIVTLSVPGATSSRIWADRHPLIDANILLGDDLLEPRDFGDQGLERQYGLPEEGDLELAFDGVER